MNKKYPSFAALLALLVLVGAGCNKEENTANTSVPQNVSSTSTENDGAFDQDNTIDNEATISNNTSAEAENDVTDGTPAETRVVGINDFAFAPGDITISVGDSITFVNRDSMQHTATARDGSFDTGLLSKDESKTITFDKAGTFNFFCQQHPSMTGTVVVE